jgi:hypothetical protein
MNVLKPLIIDIDFSLSSAAVISDEETLLLCHEEDITRVSSIGGWPHYSISELLSQVNEPNLAIILPSDICDKSIFGLKHLLTRRIPRYLLEYNLLIKTYEKLFLHSAPLKWINKVLCSYYIYKHLKNHGLGNFKYQLVDRNKAIAIGVSKKINTNNGKIILILNNKLSIYYIEQSKAIKILETSQNKLSDFVTVIIEEAGLIPNRHESYFFSLASTRINPDWFKELQNTCSINAFNISYTKQNLQTFTKNLLKKNSVKELSSITHMFICQILNKYINSIDLCAPLLNKKDIIIVSQSVAITALNEYSHTYKQLNRVEKFTASSTSELFTLGAACASQHIETVKRVRIPFQQSNYKFTSDYTFTHEGLQYDYLKYDSKSVHTKILEAINAGEIVCHYDSSTILADPCNLSATHRMEVGLQYKTPLDIFLLSTEEANDDMAERIDIPSSLTQSSANQCQNITGGSKSHSKQQNNLIKHIIINRKTQPDLCTLITLFKETYNKPYLLATPFKMFDEPMVFTPTQALRVLSMTKFDLLIFGNVIIKVSSRN